MTCSTPRAWRPASTPPTPGTPARDQLLAAQARNITLLAPLAADASPQARTGGYTADMFTIDWEHQRVTCPQGALSHQWTPTLQDGKRQIFIVGFPAATCRACPARGKCTTSARRGRQLGVRPREIHEASHGRPRRKRPALERPVQDPRRRRGHHPPGHPRHRHPHRPLPRPAQDQPRTRRRSGRHQPDPAERLVDQQPTRPDPDHPPATAEPHHRRLNPNKPTESPVGHKSPHCRKCAAENGWGRRGGGCDHARCGGRGPLVRRAGAGG